MSDEPNLELVPAPLGQPLQEALVMAQPLQETRVDSSSSVQDPPLTEAKRGNSHLVGFFGFLCIMICVIVVILLIELICLYFCSHSNASCPSGYQWTEKCGNWEAPPRCCKEIMGGCTCDSSVAVTYYDCDAKHNMLLSLYWTAGAAGLPVLLILILLLYDYLTST